MLLGIVALLAAGFIGGLSPIFLKFGEREIPPLTLTLIRVAIATLVFLPFYLKRKPNKLSKSSIVDLAKNSIFFSINLGVFSIAIQFTTAIMAQILYTAVPIIVAILSFFLLKERFSKNKIIGLIIALLGIAFLIQQSIVKEEVLTFGTPLGNILTLLAVVSWSSYMVFSKRLTEKYSPETTSFFSFVLTTMILIFIAPFELMIRPISVDKISFVGIGSVIFLGVVSSALMFFLIQFAIKKTNPFTTSFFQYLGPFVSAVVSVPLFGEKPTMALVVGGFLIIFGVFLATTYEQLKKLI